LKSRALREGRIKPFRGNNKKAIAIKRWQAALIADLGGESEITAAQWQLIDSITRLRGRIDYADLWMSKQPTLIGLDQGFYPAVGQWRMLIETMSKLLNQLFPDGIAKRIQRELTAEIADQRLLEAKKARLEAASKAGGIQEAGEPEEAEIGSGQGPNPQ